MFSKIKKKIEKNIRERKKIARNMRDFPQIVETSVKCNYLQSLSLNSDRFLTSTEKVLDAELIVSLTTFSKRLHEVYMVIESIGQQSIKANRIILWLDESEFNIDNLPEVLKMQMKRGLEIRFCPNYMSYKKIIPTLNLVSEAFIITIDDDVLYPNDMIDILVKESRQYPNTIIGHRGHKIRLDASGLPLPYKTWEQSSHFSEPTHQVMLTGCGGILYPPNTLHSDVTNIELFSSLCPKADDLWLKVMALKNNTLCKKTDYVSNSHALKNHRDIGLASTNVKKGGNDSQLTRLLNHYNIKLMEYID